MEDEKLVSVLDEGDEVCRNRILAREASTGQSSRIFYRPAEGVPFKWEMQPGTPKNPREEDVILPLCPSPLMQSMGLPLPNLDHEDTTTKTSRFRKLKNMGMKRISSDVVKKVEVILGRRSKMQESSRFRDCDEEFMVKDSSFSTYSSSNVVDNDGPFCCNPWDVPAILEEGDTRIYYCSKHKTAFAVEEDGSFLSRILTRVSTGDQFSGPLNGEISPAGVPFRWEMQPGTPTHATENDLVIPPPSPPPAVQSLALPAPRPWSAGEGPKKSTWKRAWIWLRHRDDKKKEIGKMHQEISFRCNEKVEIGSSDASFRESGSVSSLSLSRNGSSVSKIRRNFQGRYLSCGPWRKEDILVFVRGKFKPFRS